MRFKIDLFFILIMLTFAVSTGLLIAQLSAHASPNAPMSSATRMIWYVATNGSDPSGNGTFENPFRTIQHALDMAASGDTIVIMEGWYVGPGNTDLNFMGKALTLRSRDPENDNCMRNTIIDAAGRGVIVRFLNDEGPDSVFTGFTLIAGDTSNTLRGVPGFFEFSKNARPTTSRLRVLGNDSTPDIVSTPTGTLLLASSDDKLIWDGNDPFHQPAATTDYYGSGDVDLDGRLTATDVLFAQQIVDQVRPPNIRTDIDGNGVINAEDVSLISSALSGGVLPGWWNGLSTRMERNSWITKALAIDQTNEHPGSVWWVCRQFALQTFIHGAYYRGELSHTGFDGGPTIFNVPIYFVTVTGHAINAILVGDDPLNFHDWRFIEPQLDSDVEPGGWDMPYNTQVAIFALARHFFFPFDCEKVIFFVDETGWRLIKYSPNLVLTRSAPGAEIPDNRPDLWNPKVVPVGPGLLLYERTRDDMSRMNDIYLTSMPFMDPPSGLPLTMASRYSRLLDLYQESDGTVHLLWKGEPEYNPSIFHGLLDTDTYTITNVTVASSNDEYTLAGRVLVAPDGKVHIFRLGSQLHGRQEPSRISIYWTYWTGSGWHTEQDLTPNMTRYFPWLETDPYRYTFDVTILKDGGILLAWIDLIGNYWEGYWEDTAMYQMTYHNGEWGTPSIVEDDADPVGLDLCSDSSGTVHLAYWQDCLDPPPSPDYDYMGNLFHRVYDGSSWSSAETIDSSGHAGYPRMAAGTDGKIYLIWLRRNDQHITPIWNQYSEGTWNIPRALNTRVGADAWYPQVDVLTDTLLFTWSSRSSDRVTIETAQGQPLAPVRRIYLPIILSP
jgi:hypothetical protein